MNAGRVGPTTVRVQVARGAYDVVVGAGLLAEAGVRLISHLDRPRTVVVSDETVAALHGQTLAEALDHAGIDHHAITLPAGEGTKDFAHLAELLDRLLDVRVERGETIIALGGGVVGDLAGFAASILRRGVGIIQLPTTLLAQVDSAVGGKTGINTRHGKNLVGSFHQPRLVLADVAVLATLTRRDLRAGYAEVVKYGALGDRDFFDWLERHGDEIVGGDAVALERAVVESVRAKARIVARDEREAGERELLNLGHTFAHALEAAAGYGDSLRHGEAVAIGQVLAFDLSVRLGHCAPDEHVRLKRHLAAVGLPVAIGEVAAPEWSARGLIEHMGQDKKTRLGRLRLVLVRALGDAFMCEDIEPAPLAEVIEQSLNAATTAPRPIQSADV